MPLGWVIMSLGELQPQYFAIPNTPYYTPRRYTKISMPITCIHSTSQTSNFSIVLFVRSTNYLILASYPLASPRGQGLTRSGAACQLASLSGALHSCIRKPTSLGTQTPLWVPEKDDRVEGDQHPHHAIASTYPEFVDWLSENSLW